VLVDFPSDAVVEDVVKDEFFSCGFQGDKIFLLSEK
jgi:hypothetical protein